MCTGFQHDKKLTIKQPLVNGRAIVRAAGSAYDTYIDPRLLLNLDDSDIIKLFERLHSLELLILINRLNVTEDAIGWAKYAAR